MYTELKIYIYTIRKLENACSHTVGMQQVLDIWIILLLIEIDG